MDLLVIECFGGICASCPYPKMARKGILKFEVCLKVWAERRRNVAN
jgi:hypothetical protein